MWTCMYIFCKWKVQESSMSVVINRQNILLQHILNNAHEWPCTDGVSGICFVSQVIKSLRFAWSNIEHDQTTAKWTYPLLGNKTQTHGSWLNSGIYSHRPSYRWVLTIALLKLTWDSQYRAGLLFPNLGCNLQPLRTGAESPSLLLNDSRRGTEVLNKLAYRSSFIFYNAENKPAYSS